jgi:RNA polymerase sigma factor (TIGR02999 family)
MSDVTILLKQIEQGDADAADKLLPLVYRELRKLAASKLRRESANRTLQATALVHEAWIRMGGDAQPAWQNRAHFFSAAAESMRRILIDRARRRRAQRHGGGVAHVNADEVDILDNDERTDDRLLAVHDVLDKFAAEHPRKAELVKLRYFVGCTLEEAAELMNIPEGTAKRWWTYSRAYLAAEFTAK